LSYIGLFASSCTRQLRKVASANQGHASRRRTTQRAWEPTLPVVATDRGACPRMLPNLGDAFSRYIGSDADHPIVRPNNGERAFCSENGCVGAAARLHSSAYPGSRRRVANVPALRTAD